MRCPICGEENPDRARFCNACGSELAPSSQTREVRKTVTVVFCDITGFTSLSERHDPESVRRVISRYFEEMRRVVERHGGLVEKFIGDAVMAVFGMPRVHEDDAVRGVRAAVEMRSALETMTAGVGRGPGAGLRARIGVNTGEVVAVDRGTGGSLVTGDPVNVAAKLEQAAAPGEILIGAETMLLVRDAVVAEEIEPLSLPGKAETVPAFRLLTVEPTAPGHLRRLDSPMVGRERPLRLLRQGFENAMADGACELVTVLGAAGVGKSRLVEEFVRGVRDATVYRGRCVPYGEGMTYFPVLDVIKQSTGLADFDSRDRIHAAVSSVLQEEARADAITERIVELASAGESVAPEETFWAVRRFLESLARRDPLVLVFDDVQWGEGTFLDLVEHIADWSRDAPILLVAMARIDLLEIRPTWGGGLRRSLTISLDPLSDRECEELITNLVGEVGLDEPARSRIRRASDGNPLFVEEMVAKLIEEGRLLDGRGAPTSIDERASIPVPSSLSALLAARLDQLPIGERSILERASIAGGEFLVSAVRHLCPEPERSEVDERIRSLVRKDVLRPDRAPVSGEEGYRFRHILIRDAAYEGLPKEARASLHESYASWLEDVAGVRVVEQEEVLGYHLERSHRYRTELGLDLDMDLAERAAAHLAAAGRRAGARVDFPAAANLLGRAAAMLPEAHPSSAHALWEYGGVLNRLGVNSKANEVLARAAELARENGDELLEVRTRIDRCFPRLFIEPDPRAIREDVEALLPFLRDRGDDLGLTKAFQVLAFVHSLEGRYEAEAAILDQALGHARAVGDRLEESEILSSLMDSLWLGPTPVGEAIRRCDTIVAEPSIDRRTEASIIGTKAILVSMLGRFEVAREMVAEAEGIQRDLGLEYAPFENAVRSFTVEWLAGDPGAAERELLRPDHRPTPEDFALISEVDALRARALCAQGRFDEARGLIDRDDVPGAHTWAGILWATGRAKVLASTGEFGEAERLARAAVDSAARADSPTVHGDALMDLAGVLVQAERIPEAKLAASEALSLYEHKGDIVSSGKARALVEAPDPGV